MWYIKALAFTFQRLLGKSKSFQKTGRTRRSKTTKSQMLVPKVKPFTRIFMLNFKVLASIVQNIFSDRITELQNYGIMDRTKTKCPSIFDIFSFKITASTSLNTKQSTKLINKLNVIFFKFKIILLDFFYQRKYSNYLIKGKIITGQNVH